jgi:hypothetical protein
MSEFTLLILRLAFLAVLWAFVFAIVYALRSDLFGHKARPLPTEASGDTFPQAQAPAAPAPVPVAVPSAAPAPAPRSTPPPSATSSGQGPAQRLVITSGPKEGLEIELPREQLTIGRSGESGLVIRDDYTSTHHARLMLWNAGWVVQDLDSTNGTYLDGKRVTVPTPIPLNTPIKIGTTTFELRR